MLQDARRRRFDVVVVSRLDRLGRNLEHLVGRLDELHALGIAFVSLAKGIDATTTVWKVVAAAEAVSTRLLDREGIERKVLAKVAEWRALLTRQVADGRQCLREVLEGPLRFMTEGRGYRFEGQVVTGRLIGRSGRAAY